MTTLRRKLEEVQAVKVPYNEYADNPLEFHEVPEWLQELFSQQRIRPVFKGEDYWYYVLLEGPLLNADASHFREYHLKPDDWITLDADGYVYWMTAHKLNTEYDIVQGVEMPTTPNEAPIGHPEPPHETNLGKNSTPAPEMAEVAEEQLNAEEIATDE